MGVVEEVQEDTQVMAVMVVVAHPLIIGILETEVGVREAIHILQSLLL